MKKPPDSGISSNRSKNSHDFGNGEKISVNLKVFPAGTRVQIGATEMFSA